MLTLSIFSQNMPAQDKENSPNHSCRPSRAARKTSSKEATKKQAKNAKNKGLSGREARRVIVAEVERLAVLVLCHNASKEDLVRIVAALGIDHAGNNAASKSVATKRLGEHIASFGGGLAAFLVRFLLSPAPTLAYHSNFFTQEKEASDEFLAHLVERLVLSNDNDETKLSTKSEKVAALVSTLEHEALSSFFQSLTYGFLPSQKKCLMHY